LKKTTNPSGRGLSNREIGRKIYLSESGVKKRLAAIFDKLSISKREQLKDIDGM
jgi:DNA-binding NarL/FixJ family response regulator